MRRILAWSVVLATLPAAAQDAGADVAPSAWAGRWWDFSGQQGGTLDLAVTADGALSGWVTNGPYTGSWSSVLGADGTLTATYQYPGFPESQALGTWQQTESGVVAYVQFYEQGVAIGTGSLVLVPAGSQEAQQLQALGNPADPTASGFATAWENGVWTYVMSLPEAPEILAAAYGVEVTQADIDAYHADPAGWLDQFLPGYGAVLAGGGAVTVDPVLGTAHLVDAMMADASTLSAADIQRRYGGLGAMASAIAAQDEVFADYQAWMNQQAVADEQSAAAWAEWDAQMEQSRADWTRWQAEIEANKADWAEWQAS